MSVGREHDQKYRYEGGGYYSLDLSLTKPGEVHATWLSYEGKLDAPEEIPAGSMLSTKYPIFYKGPFGAVPSHVQRGDPGRKWVTDPFSGQRVCVPWDFDFDAAIGAMP